MANRIREFRERAGLSMQALADRVGTTAPQINKLEKGERRLTVDWMVRIGRALSIDPAQLMITDHTPPSGAPPHPALPAGLKAVSIDVGQTDLPVLGRAQGGKNGVLSIPAEQPPIDWTYRPPQLRGVPDAFAVFAYDDSMHPMYKHGQMLWIHPHLPVKSGDGILVIKHSDEAIIKELVRRTGTDIVLRQYQPEMHEFTLPLSEIRVMFRIIGALDLR